MRLTDTEKRALDMALEGVEGEVFLFGSRLDDNAKGGDIDILVFADSACPYRLSQKIAVRFQMECDEKIDVVVIEPGNISEEQQMFLDSIDRREYVRTR